MNKIYLYSGDFFDLLTLIASLINLNIVPTDIKNKSEYNTNLLEEPIELLLQNRKSITQKFKNHLSSRLIKTAYYVYLSVEEKKELIIYYFLKNALKYGEEIYYHRNLKCVNKAIDISTRISRENHKFKGFLRFQKMKNGFYYAKMEPTNNIIYILVPHFQKRLKEEQFLIKDVKRNIYAFYDGQKVSFLGINDIIKLENELSEKENATEDLWKTFFQTISIKERKNLKNQQNLMPKKYWKYIIEMENDDETSDKR